MEIHAKGKLVFVAAPSNWGDFKYWFTPKVLEFGVS